MSSARPSLPDIDGLDEKSNNFLHNHQHHQHQARPSLPSINAIPRLLQEEMRHTPVEKESARLIEQEMKKRPSMNQVLYLLNFKL